MPRFILATPTGPRTMRAADEATARALPITATQPSRPCPTCGGTGNTWGLVCRECDGDGNVPTTQTLTRRTP